MTACRRKAFDDVDLEECGNSGLAFYRFLKSQETGEKSDVPELLEAIRKAACPEVYQAAYTAWQATLASLGATLVMAECRSPLALGLGNESPLEVGLTFHHTYGMPMIPGSALKGLVRRALATTGQNVAAELLGKQDQAGACVFFDAWYDPTSVGGKPFHRDVVTVHHPKYYRTRGKEPPTDMDDPTPVPFLVVRPGAAFQIAILAPSFGNADFVLDALAWAMEILGVGAKTNSGYGRMTLKRAGPGGPATATAGEVWTSVLLTFNPGTQEVETRHGDLRGSAKLADLGADVPASVLDALKGKSRQAEATVTVVPAGGKNYKIIKIEEAPNA